LLSEILELATYSPFSGRAYPVEFVLVRDNKVISRLVEDRFRMKNAPYHVVDKRFAEKQPDLVEKLPPPPALLVLCGNTQKPNRLSTLLPTVSITAGTIMLVAKALGLDACWMNVYDSDDFSTELQIKSILNIPKDRLVLCMIMVGYGDKEVQIPPKQRPNISDVIHKESW